MALFEQTSPSRSSSRFGKLSSNMFFTRNTAKPKRVRHIEGLNGALICNVNDDPSVVRSASTSAFDFNRTNLHNLQSTRRVERVIPPMGFWNTYGVVQDTDRWRNELTSLAAASGLGVEKNDRLATADQQNASRSGARYSARTGRFNEGAGKSRGRTGSKHSTPFVDTFFNVSENERELWMLQVLCQLLGTSNLQDVQTWLVSASHAEKEQARTMINAALRGLKESERANVEQSVDLNSLSNFVEKQRNEEKQATQKFLKESMNRPLPSLQFADEPQQNETTLKETWTNMPATNTSTYKSAYQNYNPRSYTSFDATNNNVDEQIETIHLDDEQQRTLPPASSSQVAPKRVSTSQHRIDYLQLNENENNDEQTTIINEPILPPIKSAKDSLNENDNSKLREIQQLKTKLSRQEEESKRQLTELQAKQSRLENALKLLAKQTPSVTDKRRSKNANVKNENESVENRPIRSFSGVWKPDTSTLHRLQGN